MKKIIVIAGPTAVGKTALSIGLAKKLNGEIISADSMQVYKTLDIGTAKPTLEEMDGIPHHMIDVCEPHVKYSVADYVQEAVSAVNDILSRGKVPVVVGGTGLYIDHLLYSTNFNEGDSDPDLRSELMEKAERIGGAELKKELSSFDPESASRLHDNDIKRIVRAMEFYYSSGVTITEHNKKNLLVEKRYDADFYVLWAERPLLYDRINKRVDLMLDSGLINEAERICSADWFSLSTASQAIGYKEFVPFFEGQKSLDECVELLKQHSRNYAKRQLTWFRAKKDAIFLENHSTKTALDKIISDYSKGSII